MNADILHIRFLLGIKEKSFQLPLNNYQKLEAAGLITGYRYDLEVYSYDFLDFYEFVRNKYGVLSESGEVVVTKKALTPDKAVIEQNKGEPWTHTLVVKDNLRIEKIVFYPDECQRENEEEDSEYQEEEKRAEVIKSLVTTLPEEYLDTKIKE